MKYEEKVEKYWPLMILFSLLFGKPYASHSSSRRLGYHTSVLLNRFLKLISNSNLYKLQNAGDFGTQLAFLIQKFQTYISND